MDDHRMLVVGEAVSALFQLVRSPSRCSVLSLQKKCPLTDRSSGQKAALTIPFANILWAELSDHDLAIHYAKPTTKEVVRAAVLSCPMGASHVKEAPEWIDKLHAAAYGMSQRQKRFKVLVNPAGGKGQALKWYRQDVEPIFAAARCRIDVEQTTHQGHAIELAQTLDLDAYDVVACCSGDGLPHEVFNGLGRRKDAIRALRKIAVVQLPCGSGNAMCWNLNGTGSPSVAALRVVKGLRTPLDLVSITQGKRRTLSFLSQSVGIVAEVDLDTEELRWMGDTRFVYGVLARVLRQTVYPCDLAVKVRYEDKEEIRAHYGRALRSNPPRGPHPDGDPDEDTTSQHEPSGQGLPLLKFRTAMDELPADWKIVPGDKLGNFYAGNMAYMTADGNFFPAALPNDGTLDLICVDGNISRLSAMKTFLAISSAKIFDLAHVSYRKVVAYRVVPKGQANGLISIDGERVPFEPFQAEVHQALGTVLSRTGHLYEAPGVVSRP
ncbi:MAG: sphinganine kinase lcb4 [Phylliscum demangeonii]|nr:MAG: sphinganine kinase lcb4 [Phylliscum demangeonii]